jgi:hypothetical protein
MESIQVFDRPASQAFYSVAGRLLFIESLNPELRNLIVELFAGWQLTPVSSPDRSPDIRISFNSGETPQTIPRHLEQFEIAEGGKCYTNATGLYLELGGPVVHLENGSSVSVKVVFPELPRLGDPLLGRAASFAVCAALRRFGLWAKSRMLISSRVKFEKVMLTSDYRFRRRSPVTYGQVNPPKSSS